MRTSFLAIAFVAFLAPLGGAGRPFLTSELIFPLEHWHNHASMVVELPNGDLLTCWVHGSGERTAVCSSSTISSAIGTALQSRYRKTKAARCAGRSIWSATPTRRTHSAAGSIHYPSIIQAADGTLHATYSYFVPQATAQKDAEGRLARKSIKHAHFNEAWIRH